MKKKILAALLSLSLIGGGSVEAARYFMQYDAKGVKTPYGDNVKAGSYVQTADAKLYYEVYGQGEPILVLHGGGVGSPYELGKILDELKKKHRLIVMSTRGHGRSEIGHTPLTYKQKADDAVAVLNATVDEPVKILGFSDGAYTAYEIAALYPQYVERICAIGAGTLKAGYFSADSLNVDELEKIDSEFIAYEKSIMPEPERLQESYSKLMRFWSEMNVGEETFGAIKCPVLLITGDEDDHAPVITVLEAHQLIENSRLCVVPKAWHTAFLDNFDVTWTAIKQFINAPFETLTPSKKVEYNSRQES
ncbi:MAG: alpha/beta hydrolase [Selenomonadaceae bacterium]|nr:alpha/beta hydrolase [Selenomonadaceae bacterium]